MSAVEMSQLPDDARLWIFLADRRLTGEEGTLLGQRVQRFLERWAAHGAPVYGGAELREDQLLLVAADERRSGVSGCSIDSLYHELQALEQELGTTLLDASRVCYREEDGALRCVSRAEFRELARSGTVHAGTPVIDATVRTVGEARSERWEPRAGDAWHARAFPLGAPAR